MPVSLCMIVKNEEENLAVCLNSVKDIVDEMIIVDTGSTDATKRIAGSYGANVYDYAWNDSFADARNFSISKAACSWILIMDADDELEARDKNRLLRLAASAPDSIDIYCCRTLCYTGDTADGSGILVNLNVRLIRNGRGYRFQGRIHEQIVYRPLGEDERCPVACSDICFHHYGYLNSQICAKDKHRRNISLISRELEENPGDAFMQFNLGNEYLAMSVPEKAVACYQKSYIAFDPKLGYSPALLTRMILCYGKLNRQREMFRMIRKGLQTFPGMTDFVFLKASAYHRLGQYGRAVRAYRKCIRMGPAPDNLSGDPGVGTFKPQLSLAVIYRRLGDDAKALRYCRDAVRSCPDYREAYAETADILFQKGLCAHTVKKRLEKLAEPNEKLLLMLSDLFYDRRCWRQALDLALEAKRLQPDAPAVWYDEGVCRFYLGQYRAAVPCLRQAESLGFRADRAAFFRLFCGAFSRQKKSAADAVEKIDAAYHEVFGRYLVLVEGRSCAPFSEDAQGSQKYIGPIFDVLEILLRTRHLNEFKSAVNLLNLIVDDGVLLRLGKLYYRNGFLKLAYYELARSIKLYDRMDAEGLAMMKNSLETLPKTS